MKDKAMKFTKKQICQIVGIVTMIAILLSGMIFGIVYAVKNKPETQQAAQPQETSPMVVQCSVEKGIMLASSDAVVASDGTSSQKIIATITPASATKKDLSWSVAFKNPNSAWASGKTVTDYVSISPSSSDDTICTVTCAQAFGEQIIVTCKSVDYPDIYATATVDYVRKVSGVKLTLKSDDSSFAAESGSTKRMRVIDDADTYTFVPQASYNGTYTIYKEYDVDFTWQISTDSSKGLFGQARNPMQYTMNGKYNLSMVNTPSTHTERTVKMSLDFLCKEIFADRFTNTSQYITSTEVAGAQNCMRSAVIAGLEYCYKQSPGYILTATVSCEGYSEVYSIVLSSVDVSVPLEAISLNTSAIQF